MVATGTNHQQSAAMLLDSRITRTNTGDVVRLADISHQALRQLLARYQLQLVIVDTPTIPGSFWGEEEAGLIGHQVFARSDTPLHSILHESCHFICMDQHRRAQLHTDAGGDDAEENAVCYLQILLVDYLPEPGRNRLFADMDRWGYSFRLGSTQRWFEQDSDDAKEWLLKKQLITQTTVTFKLRQ